MTQRGGLTVGGDVVEATLVRKVECVSRKAEGPEARANARWWQFPVEPAPHYVRYPYLGTRPLHVRPQLGTKILEGAACHA